MIIRIIGDLAVFSDRGLTKNQIAGGPFFVSWEVTSTIPLGFSKNVTALRQILGNREYLDDIVFFRVDETTMKPVAGMDGVIDCSLSCFDQGLTDKTMLFASVNPWEILGDEAYQNLVDEGAPPKSQPVSAHRPYPTHLNIGKAPKPLPYVPITSSGLQFKQHGEGVVALGRSRRKLIKLPENFEPIAGGDGADAVEAEALQAARGLNVGDDAATADTGASVSSGTNNSWSDSVALANVCLNNNEVNKWGFRVYWDGDSLDPSKAEQLRTSKFGYVDDSGAVTGNKKEESSEESSDYDTSDSDDDSDESKREGRVSDGVPSEAPTAAGEGPAAGDEDAPNGGGGGTARSKVSQQTQAIVTGAARRGNITKLPFEANVAAANDSMVPGGLTLTQQHQILRSAGADVAAATIHSVPHCAVGIADVDIPLDDSKQHQHYMSSFMLDIVSGAFYLGSAKRPIYADAHTYHPYSGMVLNFALDTEEGVLNILQDGRVVLIAQVPKMISDGMHPCAEIYSEGGVVELV